MTIELTNALMRKAFPMASNVVVTAFISGQTYMRDAGILESPQRLALAFANVYAETSGLTTFQENINYTAARMAKIWPNRFNSAAAVAAKYGTGAGWQLKAFDDIYGNRMGNRPGTNDGSKFIGRGCAQITGRDGYQTISDMCGVDFVTTPTLATSPVYQPNILGAFWRWKKLNAFADAGNVVAARKAWNGGTNGLDIVQSEYQRMLKLFGGANGTAAKNVAVPTSKVDEELRDYQQQLVTLGYFEVGEADGRIGAKTLGAITMFYKDRGISGAPEGKSPTLRAELAKAISAGWHRPIAPGRAYATAESLAPKVETIRQTQRAGFLAKATAWLSGVTGTVKAAVYFLPDAHDQAAPYLSIVSEYFQSIPTWVPFGIIAAIAVGTVIASNRGKSATVADYQSGKLN